MVAEMVPHHSRLTSQPILASLFPSYFCNNSREPSPWPVLPAMPISKPIVSTLTIYSRAGQWSRFQLSCMGCEWGKRKKKKWVLFFTKRTGQAKTRFSWSIIIIVEVITNTKYVFFSPPNPGHTLPREEGGAFLILLILIAFFCQWSTGN